MDSFEGTILDPYAFSGKPKAKPRLNYNHAVTRPGVYSRRQMRPVNISKTAGEAVRPVLNIFNEFQRQRSPEYKLMKANKELETFKVKERLSSVRIKLEEKRREEREMKALQREEQVARLKDRLGLKPRSIYDTQNKANSLKLPKYKEEED